MYKDINKVSNLRSFQALLVFAPDIFADNFFYFFFEKSQIFFVLSTRHSSHFLIAFFTEYLFGTPADRLIDRFLLKIKASFN